MYEGHRYSCIMRRLVTMLRVLASPLLVLNVILILINCYLLQQPDRVPSDDHIKIISEITKRSFEESAGVVIIPVDDGSRTKIKSDPPASVCAPCNSTKTQSSEIKCNSTIRNETTGFIPSHTKHNNNLTVVQTKLGYKAMRPSYVVPDIYRPELVDCNALFINDSREMNSAMELLKQHPKVPIYEEYYTKWTHDCQQFRDRRGYVQIPLTQEEEDFPLAFSISMFTDVEQVERLLRAIYQPQNIYCIHIDTKSPLLIHRTMKRIADCFHNVFIASRLKKVKWGDGSVLLPAVSCMQDLLKYYHGKWKYLINLTGQEFPLRTNYELVRIAKIFNGSNDIAGSATRMDPERVNFLWAHRWSKTYQQTIFYNTFIYREPPDLNLTFYKGEIHGLFSPRFVEYIIESNVSRKYLDWCLGSGHPSEHYWNTLNYNQQLNAPGGYYGPSVVADRYSFEPNVRAKHWQDENYIPRECQGQVVRGICVYGVGDLPWLATRKELFANKFYLTYHYHALDCLEERHRNRTKLKQGVATFFDEDHYRGLPTVLYSRKDGMWT